jgi:polyferredoxin
VSKEQKRGRPLVRRLRAALQWSTFALTVWGGVALYRFVLQIEGGRVPTFPKPLAPEGFLPIGSLMSFKLWVTTGHIDSVHPAGLMLMTAALALSLLLKKSFCGWICPVGTLSELFGSAGHRVAGRLLKLPRWLDVPLRSLKYALLGFFLWIILVKMPSAAIREWLQTDYWKIADLKMLGFFRHPTAVATGVIGVLAVLSLVTRNFWCRYLCPYGALLGLLSMGAAVKIQRNEAHCIHCHRCTKNCPALLPVEKLTRVRSPECLGCLTCVSRCPAPGALDAALPGRRRVTPALYAALVAVIFWGIIATAQVTGHWEAGVSPAEYLRVIPGLESVSHP